MKSLATWQLLQKSLQEKTPAMLLYVLQSNGSSPGRQGFFMAVNAKGEMHGSLGGGIMEHKFVEMAKAKLKEDVPEISVHNQKHDKLATRNQSGMICSGEQTIFIYKLHEDDHEHIKHITTSIANHESGSLHLSSSGISFSPAVPEFNYVFHHTSDEDWKLTEKLGYKHRIHIIGAGHCALALSKIMRMMDFYIELYDDRDGLNTMQQNEFAHKKHLVDDYASLIELIAENPDDYVVVMTFGYRSDYIAVWALLQKKFRYLGLMGSKSKIEKMFSDYLQEGIDPIILEGIHAPIGINIKSQTPEEIAISIAAEIIKVKNENL